MIGTMIRLLVTIVASYGDHGGIESVATVLLTTQKETDGTGMKSKEVMHRVL